MKIIKILKKLDKDTPAEIYYAGEYARDILRHKKNDNIEILIRNIRFSSILKYLKKHGNGYKITNRYSIGSISIMLGTTNINISIPTKNRIPNSFFTLEDDASDRIFTINSIYIPISDTDKKAIIDIHNGKDCIKDKIIKTIGKASDLIKKDPSIILRALSISAKLGYRIDNNLFYAIKANYKLAENISIGIVRRSLIDMLMSKKPSRYLRIMGDLGILHSILPELNICVGLSQNTKYHKYDVFDHCIIACDNAPHDLVIRLAALFHDIGKAQTREEVSNNKVTFYNHEVVGSKIARRILRRFKFSKDIIYEVSNLVYNHMYNYEPNKWTDAAVRRFIKKAGVEEKDLGSLDTFPLFLVRKADRSANGLCLSEISPRQYELQDRIKRVYEKSKALSVTDLEINGEILMEEFKLKPGPTIGNVLNYLLSVVIENQSLNSRDILIEEASKYLSAALK